MHANAILTPIMRAKMIAQLTAEGLSLRATAARFHVSERTVRRWLARARSDGFPSRQEAILDTGVSRIGG